MAREADRDRERACARDDVEQFWQTKTDPRSTFKWKALTLRNAVFEEALFYQEITSYVRTAKSYCFHSAHLTPLKNPCDGKRPR